MIEINKLMYSKSRAFKSRPFKSEILTNEKDLGVNDVRVLLGDCYQTSILLVINLLKPMKLYGENSTY